MESIEHGSIPLSSPLGTSTFTSGENVFSGLYYGELKSVFERISNCGSGRLHLINKETMEEKIVPQYCDNRVCKNSACQIHRGMKFRAAHYHQIKTIEDKTRKPKAWVFTTPKKPYCVNEDGSIDIDKEFVLARMRLLRDLLNVKKHRKYGSITPWSAHMEIKLHRDSWYLHFHVVSGSIENIRLVRHLWGYMILSEPARAIRNVSYYVSKYASKVPKLINFVYALAYLRVVYKTKMHEFGVFCSPAVYVSKWILLKRSGGSRRSVSYGEMLRFMKSYFLECDNDNG